ncbi:hypothetical protein ACQY0O_003647 [Thecaphora frezii]
MASPFIGLQVKLQLRSQPSTPLVAKILSIDAATNTLSVLALDGKRIDINRADIVSLSAISSPSTPQPPQKVEPKQTPSPAPKSNQAPYANGAAANAAPSGHHHHPNARSSPRPQQANVKAAAPSQPPLSDPAIILLSKAEPSAPVNARSGAGSGARSMESPFSSPRRAHAAAQQPKSASKKKKQPHHHHQQHQTPSRANQQPRQALSDLDEEFDFGAALAQFDKKKIWDEIRSSDQTDPATLLVSHNRIAGSPTPLARSRNGVGPVNSFATPNRGDGQRKLKPNEMVLSPNTSSDEREDGGEEEEEEEEDDRIEVPISSRQKARLKEQAKAKEDEEEKKRKVEAAQRPSYEQLEERIRQLEAELAVAQRRNVLLEELAGLGLSSRGPSGVASPAPAAAAALSPPVAAPTAAAASSSGEASRTFGAVASGRLLTLLFPTAATQHAALARMEAFYEGAGDSAQTYLSLEEARAQRICRNYEAFNLPVRAVREWLEAIKAEGKSWREECNIEETKVLEYLLEQEWMNREGEGEGYIISTLSTPAGERSIEHERMHAIYYFEPAYRAVAKEAFELLSKGVRKVVEGDLRLRGYREEVWVDEFQAYLVEQGEGVFGNKAREECKEARRRLESWVEGYNGCVVVRERWKEAAKGLVGVGVGEKGVGAKGQGKGKEGRARRKR